MTSILERTADPGYTAFELWGQGFDIAKGKAGVRRQIEGRMAKLQTKIDEIGDIIMNERRFPDEGEIDALFDLKQKIDYYAGLLRRFFPPESTPKDEAFWAERTAKLV